LGTLKNEDLGILTNRDLQDVFNVIRVANHQARLSEMRIGIVKSLQQAFRAESVSFFLANREFKAIDNRNVVSVGTDLRYLDQYVRQYSCQDPFQQETHSRTTVCKVDDILPFSEWVNSRIYNELYRRLNIHYKLSINLQSSSRVLGTIGICRPKGRRDFSEREMAKARILVPHLTTALENSLQFTAIDEAKHLIEGFGHQLPPFGVIVLDYDFQPLYWSAGARNFCCAFQWQKQPYIHKTGIEEPVIPGNILDDCRSLKRQSQSNTRFLPLRSSRIIEAGGDKRFQIVSTLVEHVLPEESFQRFIIYLLDSSEINRDREEFLRDKYRLTKREVDIVRCVGQGLTNDEIGSRLYISKYTVETHLKNIFDKTKVKHRSGLSGLL
jgi:DNA-binding CsgD family transcriptional regulator